APGWIDSDLSEAYLASHPDPAAARAALVGMHPVGRTGRPADVGDLAVFLAGGGARLLGGETSVLDGGRPARLPTPSGRPAPAPARAALVGMPPVGRAGRPADVGDLAVFLAGDGARFLSGETIVLDGGRTARLPTPF